MISKNVFLLLLLLGLYRISYSQISDSTVSIRGVVVDSASTKIVSYSNVSIINVQNNKIIANSFTNESGVFIFTGIRKDSYKIIIKTVGFNNKILTGKYYGKEEDLGKIEITPKINSLKEVTITAVRPIIENKIDRLVYNPDLATIQNSATIADLLQNTPLLSLGQNGQLFLRGKPNVRIYINDKPASLDVVRGLPANSVSSIEIITNPSAKYDAEGGSIINIITKKNKLDGYEGLASFGGGVYDRTTGLFSIAIKKAKLNLSLTYSFNNLTNSGSSQNTINRPSFSQNDDGTINNNQKFQFVNIGVDYDLNSLDKIGGSVNLYQYKFKKTFNSQDRTTETADSTGNYNLLSLDHIKRYGGYGEFSYNHNFKNSNSSINFGILYNDLKINDDLNQIQTIDPTFQNLSSSNTNLEDFKELTYQINYADKLKNKSKLELGTKFVERNNNSTYSNNIDSVNNASAQNIFLYNQNILAFYGIYTFTLSKFNFQVGLRNETTFQSKESINGTKVLSRGTYNNVFPNVNILRSLKNDQQLKLSYSERIQRPGIFYLNPYVNPLDPRNISSGNPNLLPELIKQLTFDYSKSVNKSYIDLSVGYMHDNNAISSYTTAFSDSTLLNTYENVNQAHSFRGDLFFSTMPFKKDNLSLSFGEEKYYISDKQTENSGWNSYGTFRNSYSFKNDINFNVSVSYVSQQITIQGKSPGAFTNNLGLSKSFFDKKLLLSFSSDDPFRLGGIFKSYTTAPGFDESQYNKINLQTFIFRATYSFGKRSSTKAHINQMKNSDLKNGGL